MTPVLRLLTAAFLGAVFLSCPARADVTLTYDGAYSADALALYSQAHAPTPDRLSGGSVDHLSGGGVDRLSSPSSDKLRQAGNDRLNQSSSRKLNVSPAQLKQAVEDLHAQKTDKGYRINLQADVLFDFDRANLKPEADAVLEKLATLIAGVPVHQVRINGYTDGIGTKSYNLKLSERRAKSVVRWLNNAGAADPSTYVTHGFGKANPVAPNTWPDGRDNPEGRAKNRRVEIFVE